MWTSSAAAAVIVAAAPLAAGTTIAYTGAISEVLEADALDITDYSYDEFFSTDFHNNNIDICERQFLRLPGESESTQCCQPDDRLALIDGCDLVFESWGWSTGGLPESCDGAYDDWDCTGVDGSYVGSWLLEYDACDYSYNTADTVEISVVYDDTVPPEIALPSNGDSVNYWFALDKCVYNEVPGLAALDQVCEEVAVTYSITYQTAGMSDMVYADSSAPSGWSCKGGELVDSIDEDTVGTYCVEYAAFDEGGFDHQDTGAGEANAATTVSLIYEVADTTDPELSFDAQESEIECGAETDIPDPGAWCANLPCSDQPDVTAFYSLTEDLSDCEDSLTFDVGYGGCDTYALGGVNANLCTVHLADAQGACPSSCLSCTEDVAIYDSDTFDIGYGTCATYASDYVDGFGEVGANFATCMTDCSAADECAWSSCPISCETETEYQSLLDVGIDATAVYVDLSSVGTYYVPYVCTDGYNDDTNTQTVVIVDTTPPDITCPDDVELHIYDTFYEDYTHLAVTDDCGDDAVVSNDAGDTVDDNTIGTYYVTFTATDDGGLSTTCVQTVTVVDEVVPILNVDTCDGEHVNVEACTGVYTECGVSAEDNYDEEIQSKVTTTGVEDVNVWVIGTYIITYDACDSSDNCADTATRYVYVTDTTNPVVSILGDDTLILEASSGDALDASYGAQCTDTCTAITATASIGAGPGLGPTGDDIQLGMTYAIDAIDYYDFLNLYSTEFSFYDDSQYYCGEDIAAMELLAATVEAQQSDSGGTMDEISTELSDLQATCGVYEVVYTCTDWVGNTETASQWIATVDTTDPIITLGDETYGSSVSYLRGFVTDNDGYLNPAFSAVIFCAGVGAAVTLSRRRRSPVGQQLTGHTYEAL